MEFLDRVMGIHEPALKVRNKRLEILSRNIANADTPRFKARDGESRDNRLDKYNFFFRSVDT